MDTDEVEKEKRLAEILENFQMDPKAAPFSLSRGQRQMLTFASVMIMKPEILILDEPTTGLDYRECMLLMNLVKTLNVNGTTVIMVSHDMEAVTDFARKILVLHKGTVLDYDSCHKIMHSIEVLRKASVTPSQIIGLATMLGASYEACVTVEDMAATIEAETRKDDIVEEFEAETRKDHIVAEFEAEVRKESKDIESGYR